MLRFGNRDDIALILCYVKLYLLRMYSVICFFIECDWLSILTLSNFKSGNIFGFVTRKDLLL